MAGTKHKSNAEPGTGQPSLSLSLPAHALSCASVKTELNTNLDDGLSKAECARRLELFGKNELDDGPGVQPIKILIHQIANAMILVLILAMVASLAIGSYIEGGVIAFVVVINVVVGFFQEFSAEKTMDSLRSLGCPTATAVREGENETLQTAVLVPGDLVELKTGDTVPADLRLVEVMNFETDEALLTGEPYPVAKVSQPVFAAGVGAGDRLNVAFSSCTVTKGRARGVVVATGMQTQIGSIAAALGAGDKKTRDVKRNENGKALPHRYVQAWGLTAGDFVGRFLGINVGTPLQKKLSQLAVLLFGVAVILAIVVLAANRFSNNQEVIIYAVATGLAMIPACLIVVLTITMAAGTKRMVKRHVIVRKLDSLEALSSVTDICSDKTGTLTQGRMVTKKAWIPARGTYSVGTTNQPFNPEVGGLSYTKSPPTRDEDEASDNEKTVPHVDLLNDNTLLEAFLNVASLANLAHVHDSDDGWKARGDPTEIAIQVFASRFNWNRSRFTTGEVPIWSQVAEFPFDSDVKKMSVIFKHQDGEAAVFTKGAVERVLESCSSITWSEEHGLTNMTEQFKDQILKEMEALAAQGLRVLAFASKPYDRSADPETLRDRDSIEKELTFQGLIGLYDPPRPESAGAVKDCRQAGIAVHMLTGDHPGTAQAIAKQIGILPSDLSALGQDTIGAMVMTASSFDQLSDLEIDNLPVLPLVIARCSPLTKVRMISALHRRGRFAAMTGDGVNDSPSLKHADVGIAMGQTGSDVAKSASDLLLTDDNFASILAAVSEGRRIFDNIQKFVLHLLAENVALALTLLLGLVFKDASRLSVFPMSPIEILWVVMITSGAPDMGLGFCPASPTILSRPPSPQKPGIFTIEVLVDTLAYGLWMAALCLCAFSLVLFGFGNGDLGIECNETYSERCDQVFRARATTFVCMTWFALFLAWEMLSARESLFYPLASAYNAPKNDRQKRWTMRWMREVWANPFLFWAVMAGFLTVFPTLYIPGLNRVVFKHEGISWEWGVVMLETVLFVTGIESWKWGKRVWFRRFGTETENNEEDGGCAKSVFSGYMSRTGTVHDVEAAKH